MKRKPSDGRVWTSTNGSTPKGNWDHRKWSSGAKYPSRYLHPTPTNKHIIAPDSFDEFCKGLNESKEWTSSNGSH
jgi:hypothetical protein